MREVARFFLRARHWQIFLLFGIGYVGANVVMLLDMFSARPQEELLRPSMLFVFMMALFMFCFVAWFWSMGSFLNSIGEPTFRLRVGFFRFALLYPTVYMFIFFALFSSSRPAVLAFLLPLHFFAMFCLFYDLYFVSKSLALVETGKLVSFSDYAGSFFLLWIFPLGVWFIQPRINRLYAERSSTGAISGTIPAKS